MSSILKALEKAEESNSTKRMAGDSDLIRSRKSRPTWVLPGAVLGTAALAVLVTFAIMGGFSRPAPSAKLPVVVTKTAPAPSVATPVNTVIETPAIVPEQAAPGGSVKAAPVPGPKAPLVSNRKAAAKPEAKVTPQVNAKAAPQVNAKAAPQVNAKAAPQVSAKVTSPLKSKTATLPVGKAQAAVTKVQAVPAQTAPAQARVEAAPAVVPVPAHPEPKVSGIAWQSTGESSFAVVNGRAVLQGSTVDGFKVLEIHQDAVKFSGSNGTFEVLLGGEEK